MSYPSHEEVFDKPYPPAPPIPPAWEGDSITVNLADREIARLIANCLFTPPITEKDIEQYAQQFKMPQRQAEMQLRRMRDGIN